ncbi:TauD/TfdA family dioxygenase [Wenyingzhuangia sp. chi5]|uniref:TauD/TfdA family dioxygenase n=1 Tax=Wenyingzhuangia gilva TaxID=3057677 RepID=A0ABT8VVI9_9FLAO|nr:TauD/TfdA family dioxygenase [Wenyingzhuangia sp. chi5]MDO3695991.1 TauD/TfdA family dioxygenase [Wenyingzhuangia sp. chi5]
MTKNEHISLKTKGWTEFKSGSSDNELISIASEIGKILKHPNGQNIFNLRPILKDKAIKGTFSNKHGLDEFPFHTDTAFLKKPARYILMHSEKPSNCNTTIISRIDFWDLLSQIDKSNAERAIYLVKTNSEIFYTSFIFRENNIEGIKYDPSCMFPFNKYAKIFDKTFQQILSIIQYENIKWSGNKTVLIDNWKSLHGRKSVKEDTERELKRIYIN